MSDADSEPAVSIRVVETEAIGVSSDREARLDLLLAEELSVDHKLAQWFVTEAGTWCDRWSWPDSDLERIRARVNYWDHGPEIPPDDEGETDVDLTLWWEDGTELALLIEHKVSAVFQPRQAERYAARARARAREGMAVLVAPAAYLASHHTEAKIFDGAVAVEEIIARIRDFPAAQDPVSDRRATWRALLLEELIRRRDPIVVSDPDSVAFTEFCAAWLAEHAPAAIPNLRSCHTAGQGWLWFESPRGLGYKASGWAKKPRAAVDLYVAEHGFHGTVDELGLLVVDLELPDDFYVTTDTAKPPNVVLRYDCDKVFPSEGRPVSDSDRERAVIDALEACAAATEWVHRNEERLAATGEPSQRQAP